MISRDILYIKLHMVSVECACVRVCMCVHVYLHVYMRMCVCVCAKPLFFKVLVCDNYAIRTLTYIAHRLELHTV